MQKGHCSLTGTCSYNLFITVPFVRTPLKRGDSRLSDLTFQMYRLSLVV